MKKIFAIILVLCIFSSFGSVNTLAAQESSLKAQYATVAPTIDGEIDEIWGTTEEIRVVENPGFAYGYAKILWTEDTLYLLADVFDETIDVGENSTSNQACFWVSETGSNNDEYFEVCDWNLSINQAGVFEYYSGVDMEQIITYAVKTNTRGYVVEIAVPVQTEDYNYVEGAKIGFCLSVEDDVDGDNERDSVVATQQDINYWSYPKDIYAIALVKQDNSTTGNSDMPKDEDDIQEEDISGNSTPSNDITTGEDDAKTKNEGCGSSITGGALIMIPTLVGMAFVFKKKED